MVTLSAKEKILKLLKGKRLSTSRIANELTIDYNFARKLLTELECEGFIKGEQETISKYWLLNSDRYRK